LLIRLKNMKVKSSNSVNQLLISSGHVKSEREQSLEATADCIHHMIPIQLKDMFDDAKV
jgi:hypothetical protein